MYGGGSEPLSFLAIKAPFTVEDGGYPNHNGCTSTDDQ